MCFAGSIFGLISSIAALLGVGSTYEGGLSDFYTNTSQSYSLLAGMTVGFAVGGIVSIGVSLKTHKITSEDDTEREWAKTMNIDNPINPFRAIYEEELAGVEVGSIITAKTMDKVFRKARQYAIVGGVGSLVVFVVVIPAVALSFGVLEKDQFSNWMQFFQYYCFFCTAIVVVFPPFEEGYQIFKRCKKNKQSAEMDEKETQLNMSVKL